MAKIEVESLLATMDSLDPDEEYPSSPLLEVFHSIWLRVAAVRTGYLQKASFSSTTKH